MPRRVTRRRYAISAPRSFRLRPTVLSHGWVFLPPFAWDGRTLEMRLSHGRNRAVVHLNVKAPGKLVAAVAGPHDAGEAAAAIRWALRLDEDFSALHELAAGDPLILKALRLGWGRLLRAPTVWEEAVRVLCTTNVQWAGTVAMMQGLVGLGGGFFPTPAEIEALGEGRLRSEARMGYRAASLITLARAVRGGLDLEAWLRTTTDAEALDREVRSWRGFGPYASAHLLVQLGHYGRLPIDSEVRAFHMSPRGRVPSDERIRALYAPYGDYAFLAYKLRRIATKRNWIGEEVSVSSTK